MDELSSYCYLTESNTKRSDSDRQANRKSDDDADSDSPNYGPPDSDDSDSDADSESTDDEDRVTDDNTVPRPAVPTSNRTFPFFGSFPKEIRDMIWDRAGRDARPGVHFFSFRAYEVPQKRINPSEKCGVKLNARGQISYTCSAPRLSAEPDAAPSWYERNPSIYLTEVGLWGACRESRAAVVRARTHGWGRDLSFSLGSLDEYGLEENPAETGRKAYLAHNGLKHHFTVLNQDLVCLQLPAFPNVWESCLLPFPVNHCAVEMKADWGIDVHDLIWSGEYTECETGRLAALRSDCYRRCFWIVDYRIRRTRNPARAREGVRPGRKVFYALGRRYVQVRLADDEWEYEDGEALHEGDGTAFGLAEELERDAIAHLYDSSDGDGSSYNNAMAKVSHYRSWDSPEDPTVVDQVGSGCGVLACEAGDY